MLIVSHKEIFLGNPRARQRPKRPAQQGHEETEPVKAATRSRLLGEEGDAQNNIIILRMVLG